MVAGLAPFPLVTRPAPLRGRHDSCGSTVIPTFHLKEFSHSPCSRREYPTTAMAALSRLGQAATDPRRAAGRRHLRQAAPLTSAPPGPAGGCNRPGRRGVYDNERATCGSAPPTPTATGTSKAPTAWNAGHARPSRSTAPDRHRQSRPRGCGRRVTACGPDHGHRGGLRGLRHPKPGSMLAARSGCGIYPVGGRLVVVAWRKRVWRCVEPACAVQTWTEQTVAIGPGAVLTERAPTQECRRVGTHLGRGAARHSAGRDQYSGPHLPVPPAGCGAALCRDLTQPPGDDA